MLEIKISETNHEIIITKLEVATIFLLIYICHCQKFISEKLNFDIQQLFQFLYVVHLTVDVYYSQMLTEIPLINRARQDIKL